MPRARAISAGSRDDDRQRFPAVRRRPAPWSGRRRRRRFRAGVRQAAWSTRSTARPRAGPSGWRGASRGRGRRTARRPVGDHGRGRGPAPRAPGSPDWMNWQAVPQSPARAVRDRPQSVHKLRGARPGRQAATRGRGRSGGNRASRIRGFGRRTTLGSVTNQVHRYVNLGLHSHRASRWPGARKTMALPLSPCGRRCYETAQSKRRSLWATRRRRRRHGQRGPRNAEHPGRAPVSRGRDRRARLAQVARARRSASATGRSRRSDLDTFDFDRLGHRALRHRVGSDEDLCARARRTRAAS